MPTAYKVMKRVIQLGDRKGETVYNVAPVCYGTLTTDDVARQIATESTASPGDVKNVLDRYAYYVAENLKKGYAIELLGFGKLYLRFVNGKSVSAEKDATAALVKALVPGFRPSFTMVNNSRIYDLIPEKIGLVKYNGAVVSADEEDASGDRDDDGGSPL
ncbi:HU family DNA-binding protein [uncultured Bacteroides sp.]|uniref:HU family DNA-binding protein n=1 Tax=uncultured Bacteroides sp. TaxID=162156 RepID=UPI00260EDF4E|nr:HU family DNA-binding protein [uncultured Bacteroides sp.]